MLNQFLFTKIEEEDIGNIWFQQETTLDVLHPVFEDRIIRRRADVAELQFNTVGLLFVGYRQR